MYLKTFAELQETAIKQNDLKGTHIRVNEKLILLSERVFLISRKGSSMYPCKYCKESGIEQKMCRKKIYFITWGKDNIFSLCNLLENHTLEEIEIERHEILKLLIDKKIIKCGLVYRETGDVNFD